MNVKEQNTCRLCLKVAKNGFELIDEIIRQTFEVLLLRVNLDISNDPIVCKHCKEVAIKCFDFKSVCIDTEEIIVSFALDINRVTYESTDFRDGKDTGNVDGKFLCRFCSNHLSGDNVVLLETLTNDFSFAEMLRALMPEMNFGFIKNPVICTNCKRHLECYFKFVRNCWGVEKEISKYCRIEGAPSSGQVELSKVLLFSSKNIIDLDCTEIIEIDDEEDALDDISGARLEVYDEELINGKEELDIIEHGVSLNETACETKSKSDKPAYNLNIPCGSEAETELGVARRAFTQNISLAATTTNYRNYRSDTIQRCGIKSDIQSNVISSGTGIKTKKNKEKRLLSSTKNRRKAQVLKCATCTYETNHKNHLRYHMLTHRDGTGIYMCSKCNYKTKTKNLLVQHELVHKDISEVEIYKCANCSYETKRKSDLRNHMLIHIDVSEADMHKCTMCTYQAKRKNNFKKHMLNHQTLYKCSICTFSTPLKRYLKQHMSIHADVTNIEKYKCSMCGYVTKRKKGLIDHTLIHKDVSEVEMHKCSICTYKSKRKCDLRKHMLKHKDISEVTNHKCTMCAYVTKHKGSLKQHMITHMDVREVEMHKCSMCTFQAKRKGNLKLHMLVHRDMRVVENV